MSMSLNTDVNNSVVYSKKEIIYTGIILMAVHHFVLTLTL